MPPTGLEPVRKTPADFKSAASTDYATAANTQIILAPNPAIVKKKGVGPKKILVTSVYLHKKLKKYWCIPENKALPLRIVYV